MLSALLSRLILLVCGTLYPAYASHKAIKTKNVKEYVKWMMYWVVFALYTFVEIFTDIFVAFWMPCYYELKIVFVLWLSCPATRGSSYLYRKIVHPYLQNHEEQFDAYLEKIWDHGYEFCRRLGSQGFSYLIELVADLMRKGQISVAAKLPMIMELAQEANLTSTSSQVPAADDEVDQGTVEFEDYDVVEPTEISGASFSFNGGNRMVDSSDAFIRSFIDDVNNEEEEEVTSVDARPLRLRRARPSPKRELTPEESVTAATKGGKVRQRRTKKT